MTVHSGRVANALACNAGDDRFAPHLWRYFRDLFLESIQSLIIIIIIIIIIILQFIERHLLYASVQRDVKWSVWHCRTLLRPVMSAAITVKNYLVTMMGRDKKYQTSSTHTHTQTVHAVVGG